MCRQNNILLNGAKKMINKKATSAVVTYHYNHPADTVFRAWLDERLVKKWLFPGELLLSVEINPKIEDEFSFVVDREGTAVDHRGKYIEIEAPKRLAFTICIPRITSDTDTITIVIDDTREGCQLTLTHEVHPNWADCVENAERAWKQMLAVLERVLDREINGGIQKSS
jgi:uncharacterized protein YndB with AHSA1/START domain